MNEYRFSDLWARLCQGGRLAESEAYDMAVDCAKLRDAITVFCEQWKDGGSFLAEDIVRLRQTLSGSSYSELPRRTLWRRKH